MLQKYNTWKIARLFFDNPSKSYFLREIGREVKLAHTSVMLHLKTLKACHIIREKMERQGSRTFNVYISDYEAEAYRFYKKIDMLVRIKESGCVELLEKEYVPDSIVLFGSAAKGEDIEGSDVDLFIQANEKEINLEKIEKILKRKIQLHVTPNIKNYPRELQSNIANGIVLYGFLGVI